MKQLMSALLVSVISVVLVFTPVLAYATEPVAQECQEPVAVVTPCSGVLLPTSAATMGLQCLSVTVPRLQADVDFLTTTYTSRENRYRLLLDAEVLRGDRLFNQLQDSTLMAAPKWYEHPVFWFSVGFVVAGATTVGITYAVNSD